MKKTLVALMVVSMGACGGGSESSGPGGTGGGSAGGTGGTTTGGTGGASTGGTGGTSTGGTGGAGTSGAGGAGGAAAGGAGGARDGGAGAGGSAVSGDAGGTRDGGAGAGDAGGAVATCNQKWNFDTNATGGLPAGWRSVLGAWKVEADAMAASAPNVLRQSMVVPGTQFPMVLVDGVNAGDVTVRVKCRAEKGMGDQACGIVVRAQDDKNYVVVRSNAIEGNIRIYNVVNGVRGAMFATKDMLTTVTANAWHTFELAVKGAAYTVKWDGVEVLTTMNTMFTSGKIGLWTKGDSISAYDDFECAP